MHDPQSRSCNNAALIEASTAADSEDGCCVHAKVRLLSHPLLWPLCNTKACWLLGLWEVADAAFWTVNQTLTGNPIAAW